MGLGETIEEVMGLEDHDEPEPDGIGGKRVEVAVKGATVRGIAGGGKVA